MLAVFLLLQTGQDTFRREPEVADMNQSARTGLDMISRDLIKAGFETPPALAVLWTDVTIIYADENVPTSRPEPCDKGQDHNKEAYLDPGGLFPEWLGWSRLDDFFGRFRSSCTLFPVVHAQGQGGGGCGTIERSSVLNIPPDSFVPSQSDPEQAYQEGQVLFALETSCECDTGGDPNKPCSLSAIPFEVTHPPQLQNTGTLKIIHNSGGGSNSTGNNQPGGFDRQVDPECAVIGLFHMIEYRINPIPPAANPILERRDLAISSDWTPVSNNIENLQFQYALGSSDVFVDDPAAPAYADPATWITRVKVTVAGRSESRNLEGASAGVFAAEDTHLRRSFSTTMVLRNQVFSAARETDNTDYN
jgi:hypothetical protein